jgi:hypothetical protein
MVKELGTKESPWQLKKTPLSSDFTIQDRTSANIGFCKSTFSFSI